MIHCHPGKTALAHTPNSSCSLMLYSQTRHQQLGEHNSSCHSRVLQSAAQTEHADFTFVCSHEEWFTMSVPWPRPSSASANMAVSAIWCLISFLKRARSATRAACPSGSVASFRMETYRSPLGKCTTYCRVAVSLWKSPQLLLWGNSPKVLLTNALALLHTALSQFLSQGAEANYL